MMSKWSKPWLQDTHKNFFLIYVITAVHFVWVTANALFGGVSIYATPVLHYVNYIHPFIWGGGYAIVAALLILGLFRVDFRVARYGLALGLIMELGRFLLILFTVVVSGVAVANALANLLVVVGVCIAQLREPVINPFWDIFRKGR